jgi:hypothetical protein
MNIARRCGPKELFVCNAMFFVAAIAVVILAAAYPLSRHKPIPEAKINAAAEKIFSDSATAQEVGPLLMYELEQMQRALEMQSQDFREMGLLFGCCAFASYLINVIVLLQWWKRGTDKTKIEQTGS